MWVKVDAAERVSKDVWKLRAGSEVYVLEQTGEVLGTQLRKDWAKFISTQIELDDVIKTKNDYDSPRGLARGFTGDKDIARRAILSSCVGERWVPARPC